MRSRDSGFTLVELLAVLAVLALLSTVSVPPLLQAMSRIRLRVAAEELVVALRSARSWAIRHGANVAVRFDGGAGGRDLFYALFRDGDGDGVLNADIRSGVDPRVTPDIRFQSAGGGVHLGLPAVPVRDPGDPGRWLDQPEDPIRFNQSDLASFDPLGGSTPGSLYLTNGPTQLVAVRVPGRTGKVRVITYDFARGVWH